ncbi:MAG: tetratricopeptide repeat protein [Planctomycetota bacterium]|nr:MAG: tetratricopeptide repeat protein [Planctomycetota bacterium]
MKLSWPVKYSLAGFALLAVVVGGLVLWTPVRMRYYRAKYFSGNVRQCATGCKGLLSYGGRGVTELTRLVRYEFLNSPDKRRVIVVDSLLSLGEEGLAVLAGEFDGGMNAAKFLAVHWAHADRPIKGEAGRSYPLRVAAEKGYAAVASLFISKGAKVNAKGRYDWTPLHTAAKWGHRNVAEVLVRNGAAVDAKLAGGDTPLFCAARAGMVGVADFLISGGAGIGARNERGWTPVFTAVSEGRKEFCVFLIEKGADINAKDRFRWTPLHEAASGDIEIVELLIAAGANVNAKDDTGRTPLHEAASCDIEIVKLLVAAGADVRAKDDRGCTPLDAANAAGKEEIASFLIEKGAEPEAVAGVTEKKKPAAPPEKTVEEESLPVDEAIEEKLDFYVSKFDTKDMTACVEGIDGLLSLGNAGEEELAYLLPEGKAGVKFLKKCWEDVNKPVDWGRGRVRKPLLEAARMDYDFIEEILIAMGAKVDKEYISYYRNLGHRKTEGRNPDWAGAEKIFSYLLKLKLDDEARKYTYYGRGKCRRHLGEFDKSIEDFDEALKIDPKFYLAYYERGLSRYEKGDLPGARNDITEAIDLSPTNPDYFFLRGKIYVQLRLMKLALADLNIAIRSKEHSLEAHHNRGLAWFYSGGYSSALRDFNKVLDTSSNFAISYFYRAKTYYRMGKVDKACSDMLKYIKWERHEGSHSDSAILYWCAWQARETGHNSVKQVAQEYKAMLYHENWPVPIMELFAGERTEEALLEAAKERKLKDMYVCLCEAYYYAAELRLANKDKDGATALFSKCLATGMKTKGEYGSAEFELKRLSGKKKK